MSLTKQVVPEIYISTDENFFSASEKKEINKIFSNTKLPVQIEIVDTHAKGGMHWFPTGLIITITKMTAGAFFGAFGKDIYQNIKKFLVKKYSKVNWHDLHDGIYFEFHEKNLELVFQAGPFEGDYEEAIKKLVSKYKKIVSESQRLKKLKFETIIGKYRGIRFEYDAEEKKWVIAHFYN